MKNCRFFLVVLFFVSIFVWSQEVFSAVDRSVILVDKSSNELRVAQYQDSEYRILKTYRATVGRVQGDKVEEGDLKTPEGIYRFTSLLRPPSIKPKFGVMAFYMDYPNAFDRLAGQTGYDIMLHATDEPSRLEKDLDSEGCIVVKNEELQEIEDSISVGLTPILVFDRLEPSYLRPVEDPRLVRFVQDWLKAWEGRDIENYISKYHSEFSAKGKNVKEWKAYKNALNRRYAEIKVNPSNLTYLRHPKYAMVMFRQDYQSKLNNGRDGYHSVGTKILYIGEENDQLRIVDEDFTKLTW